MIGYSGFISRQRGGVTKNTGDTEQNNHTMDASKFQVNFLQLLLNWTKRVISQGELYIEMFIKEAMSYKLELYETQY